MHFVAMLNPVNVRENSFLFTFTFQALSTMPKRVDKLLEENPESAQFVVRFLFGVN